MCRQFSIDIKLVFRLFMHLHLVLLIEGRTGGLIILSAWFILINEIKRSSPTCHDSDLAE